MDNIDLIRELLLAFKFELIRFRYAVVVVFVIVIFAVTGVGVTWQDQYVSAARLEVDDSNIIQPLLKGAAEFSEIDRVEEAKKFLFSKRLLQEVAFRLEYINEDTDPVEVSQILRAITQNTMIESDGKQSNYFTVSYFSSDPEVAFETAKVLIEEFVKFHQSEQRDEGLSAYDFISKQANNYKSRLEAAEQALKEFKSQNLDTDEDLVRSNISDLEAQIQELRLSIQESESTIRATRKQLGSEGEYLKVQARVYALRQQKQSLENQLNQLRLQFQDSYPDIVTLKAQIREIDERIANDSAAGSQIAPGAGNFESKESNPELLFDELRKTMSVSEVELETKRRRLSSLERLLAEKFETAQIVASNQATLSNLMRDYTVTKNVYEEMLSRKENAELSVAITTEGRGLTYRVLAAPSYPLQPSGLTFTHFLLAAPVLAIGVPIGLVLAMILLDPKIRTVINLKNVIEDQAELLGSIPHYHTALSTRVLRKDIVILAGFMIASLSVFAYLAQIGLASSL